MIDMKNDIKNYELIDGLIKKLKDIENDFVGSDTYAVGGVLENKFLYDRFVTIVNDNSKINKSNSFLNYIKINYITSIIIAVCRQVDKNSDSVSLINFLEEIYSNADKITKKWFVSQYKTLGEEYSKKDFEENFGSLTHVDPGIIYADIGKLLFYTKEIKKFRNKKVAHLDKNKKIKFDIDFNILYKAIDLIEEIIKKYQLLLTQSWTAKLLPEKILSFRNDGSNEEDIFCVPWKNCKDI